MATCWALWQRMPPRYQLTSRCAEEEETNAENRSPRTPRTPRNLRVSVESTTTGTKRPTIAGGPPTGSRTSSNNKRFNFPNRRSGYINHFKTQQRVNSARVKFTSDQPISSQERASTAPTFPVQESSLDSRTNPQLNLMTHGSNDICNEHKVSLITSFDTEVQTTQKPVPYADESNANTFTSDYNPIQKESAQRKFNVRETEEGTMYIDNGKVIFFKKSRHDPSVLLKTKSTEGGFLASIRREYLNKPKYLSVGQKKASYVDDRLLQRERVYYNQKVGHILDYYSRDDEDMLSVDDITRYTKLTDRVALPPRSKSPKNSQIRRLYVGGIACSTERTVPHSCTTPHPGIMDSQYNTSYMKVHRQLKLHDRKFYLRTPGMKNEPTFHQITQADIENCKCGMCKIELQLSLMAQLGITAPLRQLNLDVDANSPVDYVPKQPNLENKPRDSDVKDISKDESLVDTQTNVSIVTSKGSKSTIEQDPSSKQQECNLITVTVPGMKPEREGTEVTLSESVLNTSRSFYSTQPDEG